MRKLLNISDTDTDTDEAGEVTSPPDPIFVGKKYDDDRIWIRNYDSDSDLSWGTGDEESVDTDEEDRQMQEQEGNEKA